jgi:hypothetical protein
LPIEKVVWRLFPISNQQSAIGNRQSAMPAILGQAMIAEILRKKRRSAELVLQGGLTRPWITQKNRLKVNDELRSG